MERPIESLVVEIEGMNDAEFKAEYRLSKPFFWRLYRLIEDDTVFNERQRPAEFQLLVFLQFVGFSGNGSSYRRNARLGRCSVGSVREFSDRCVVAIRAHIDRLLQWPGRGERRQISAAFAEQHGIPNCVGVVDGTLITLAQKPSKHGEDYYTRKSTFALNAIFVCDHRRRVQYVYAEWPGSAHDQRVFQNSALHRNICSLVGGSDFLLGDSAFTASRYVVSPFKKPPKRAMEPIHEAFNERVSSLRICIEHCIGMLKGQFQCLKEIRIRVSTKPASVRRVVQLIEACVVIHNLCIDDDIPAAWIEPESDDECVDEDTSGARSAHRQRGDPSRREQLLQYLIDHDGLLY